MNTAPPARPSWSSVLSGEMTLTTYRVTSFVWFCTEIGGFVEGRMSLQENPLYWPLWCFVCLALALAVIMIDLLRQWSATSAAAATRGDANTISEGIPPQVPPPQVPPPSPYRALPRRRRPPRQHRRRTR